MNSDTNHLVSGEEFARILRNNPELASGYDPLPPALEGAARKVLQGRRAVKIARHSGGKLSRYAAAQRAERRQATKNKTAKRTSRRAIEKKTRKANRGR